MNEPRNSDVLATVERVYCDESRQIYATLVRLLRDFDLAEEAMHEAFAAAVEQWGREGIPANPSAWLVSTGRFKAIDALRRRGRFQDSKLDMATRTRDVSASNAVKAEEEIEDDRLRLIFACCHPAIAPNIQVALTLREVCGLTTEEIAGAFLTSPATMAQRIVRGKAKIRDAGIAISIPDTTDLPERLDAVLAVVYLLFNEGYSASVGTSLTRGDLTGEAIRLGRLLAHLMPNPEVFGLLALMLLQESRRTARSTPDGDLILLKDQDRSLWNRELIAEGRALAAQAIATRRFGAYTIQAAIASVHAGAESTESTDWAQIVSLYDALQVCNPSPVVELNRAVAVAMRDGPAAGIDLVDKILSRGELVDYHLLHAARAEFCRRLGSFSEARDAYLLALSLTRQEPEQRFLRKRIESME